MKKYISLFLIVSFFGFQTLAQQQKISLHWLPLNVFPSGSGDTVRTLGFEGAASHFNYGSLPVWHDIFVPGKDLTGSGLRAELSDMIFETLPQDANSALDIDLVEEEISMESFHNPSTGNLHLYVVPVRKNVLTNSWERLTSFTITLKKNGKAGPTMDPTDDFVSNSKLAEGNWYKIYVSEDGMHQLTVEDLNNLGLPVSSIDPKTIKLYGNGAGMLPENNSDVRLDDLNEIAIHVSGEDDGSFGGSDKITFFGESAHKWSYNPVTRIFEQQVNIYAKKNCYYITYGGEAGKRIATRAQSAEIPTNVVTTVDYYANHELEDVSIAGSGREWYGEIFDIQTSYTISFDIEDVVLSSPVDVYGVFAARSETSSYFNVNVQGEDSRVSIKSIGSGVGADYYDIGTLRKSYTMVNSNLDIKIDYVKPISSAVGWLDRIRINARRELKFHGGQMLFCDSESAYYGHIAEYRIANAGPSVKVYDVSDHQNVTLLEATSQNGEVSFVADAGKLYNYLAIDGDYKKPELGKRVANQNLHAHNPVNMVIVTHPDFSIQAKALADFHNARGLTTRVVNVFEIYNEFSCGAQDITAIRDYMRMLYVRSSGESGLRYLLLFGDASYDYLDRIPENENFIPTWQSPNSFGGNSSYATDDYFGMLDPWEGKANDDNMDIGIGRLIVTNTEQADMAINKIFNYCSSSPEVMGDWRNNITIVADDEDTNLHIEDADKHARFVESVAPEYNINKVYLDSYQQVTASGGQRYPDANEAINTNMAKGNLIINYVGHGGVYGWALERVLELSDINSWTNYDKLALFITATCEFSRYDDPMRVSAGEQVFLNEKGGAVALMTTSRPTFAHSNYTINHSIYSNAFKKTDDKYPSIGDLMKKSKNAVGSGINAKKFILIGDPAMKLAYPELKVETTHYNGEPVSIDSDTIKALDFVTISGHVFDDNGKTDDAFNGIVYPTVYDKPSDIISLGNDAGSSPFEFQQLNRILYRGQAEVVDGKFSFSFQTPKDINYSYGYGKISYYVSDGYIDGHGYDNHFIVGGYSNVIQSDDQGPQIKLFINDRFFINGGITDPNPNIYAEVYDESGINVGTGIGHDITAILDDNTDKVYVLNDFYQGSLNSYRSGVIEYPLFNLSEGEHTLRVKVWDALNNSSTAEITFVVFGEGPVTLDNLNCYPNPFSHQTQIFFEHNQSGELLNMDYMIFDLSGRLVYDKVVKEKISGSRTSSITWSGTDNYGSFLPAGVYICKLIVTNEENLSSVVNGKFVLTR